MKRLLVVIGENKKIDVKFMGEPVSHKELRLVKRAIEVEFKRYHYRLLHPKVIEKEAKTEIKKEA